MQHRVRTHASGVRQITYFGVNPFLEALQHSDASLRGKNPVPPEKWKDGEFTAPHGACWDSKGDLYVEDWNATGRINKLKRIKA